MSPPMPRAKLNKAFRRLWQSRVADKCDRPCRHPDGRVVTDNRCHCARWARERTHRGDVLPTREQRKRARRYRRAMADAADISVTEYRRRQRAIAAAEEVEFEL